MKYFVTSNWRGAMHVDPMRIFDTEEEAQKYARTLTGGTPKIYQVFNDKPPKAIKVKE